MATAKDKEEFAHDWYTILGCDHSSSKEEIGKAARKLSVKYHPDKTSDPDAPEKFLLVQRAKDILLDDVKRKTIDDHRSSVAKRQAYEANRNKNMDARRKRMRDELNEKVLHASSLQKAPSQAEIHQKEMKKRTKLVDELRQKNADLMQQSRDEAASQEKQKTHDFYNYRKAAVEEVNANNCCQLKVKWKRTAESHSDDSLYKLFKQFGSVEDAVLVGSKGTSGLITFTEADSARKAVEHFKHSEDYRVSLLEPEASSANKSTFSAYESSKAQQSELSKDIRRAMEKNNLLDILHKFKRPTTSAVDDGADGVLPDNAGMDATDAAASAAGVHTADDSTGSKPSTAAPSLSLNSRVPTGSNTMNASALASKESDVLLKMMEAARRKKLQSQETAATVSST